MVRMAPRARDPRMTNRLTAPSSTATTGPRGTRPSWLGTATDLEAPVQEPATSSGSADHLARFTFAPPRHFVLPAVLLLLSEAPSYGYELVKDLRAFRFGDVDRP